jgi:hypothetical protein
MISRDELQARILAELEECAAEEVLVALFNTVIDETQGRPEEVTLFREAMEQLIDKDLVLMASERDASKYLVEVDAPQSRAMLVETLRPLFFRADDRRWTADPFVRTYAVLTDAGRLAGKKLLDERGYRWWYHEDNDGTA